MIKFFLIIRNIIILIFLMNQMVFLSSNENNLLKKHQSLIKDSDVLKDLQKNLPYKLNEKIQEYIIFNDFNDNIYKRPLKNSNGNNIYYFHIGIDLITTPRSEIYPTSNGVIFDVDYDETGLGWYIIIKHLENIYTIYGHLAPGIPIVKKGESVTTNTIIGYSGTTGIVSSSILSYVHYGIVIDDQYINPLKILDKDKWELIQFHENYQQKKNSFQYNPHNITKLKLDQDKLIYTIWGPEGGGEGLYLKFLKDFTYNIWDYHGTSLTGKYEIKNNFVLLNPDDQSKSIKSVYAEFQIPQQYEYIFDSNNLINSIKLNHKIQKDFYDLNSLPDLTKIKKINDIEAFSTGVLTGIITRDIYIRIKPDSNSGYYLSENDNGILSPFLPAGHEIFIFGKTVDEYEIDGKKGYWYYCDLNILTYRKVIISSDKEKKDISFTIYKGWVFSGDIDIIEKDK